MKNRWKIGLLSTIIAIGWATQGETTVVMLDQSNFAINNRQPIQATIVDRNGQNYQQTVYYDPAIRGVDLDARWAGPNASIYFPTLNTGYVWYNGYWVNPEGYYWNGGNRYSVGPTWNDYWGGYWKGRGYWNGNWHDHNWHGEGWHGGGDWHGGDVHGGGWHGGDVHGGAVHGGEWHGGEARGGDARGDGHRR